jgi:malate dehydrogenase
VPKGLVFGYPSTTDGKGNFKVIDGLKFDDFGKAMFQKTLNELLEEQDAVKDLMPD